MATGRPAFTGSTTALIFDAILHKQPTSPQRLNPDLPDELVRVIDKCLEKERELRYQSAADLCTDLKRLRRDSTLGASPVRSATRLVGFRRRLIWTAAAALVAVTGAWASWRLRQRPPAPPPTFKITPFTTDGGAKSNPQLSPDGEKAAYSWRGSTSDEADIYVKALGLGAKPIRLTADPAPDILPAWSPDGRQIAFVRVLEETAAIYLVPSLGGQERKLTDIRGPLGTDSADYFVPSISWSPKGDWLALAEKARAHEPSRIVRLSLATLEREPITSPPPVSEGDLQPSLSPDGKELAFVRSGLRTWGNLDVWVQPVEARVARRVTFQNYGDLCCLAWTPDGRDLVFSTESAGGPVVRRVSRLGGEPQPIPGVGQSAGGSSIRGSRMVYGQWGGTRSSIWRAPGLAALPRPAPTKLIASSASEANPSYSPDGRRIAFESDRSGVQNIWVCDSNGSNAVQVTSFEGASGTPRWAPDGRRLLFDSIEAGDWNLYVVDVDGGVPRRLTPEPSTDSRGAWSHDGRWIYFESDRTGRKEIWKLASDGGEASRVTRGGGVYAQESPDGKFVYYSKEGGGSVWRMATDGGEEAQVLQRHTVAFNWALSVSGLFYITAAPDPFQAGGTSLSVVRNTEYRVQHLDTETGRVTELSRDTGPFLRGWLAVSPDEKWLLYAEQPPPTSELMLIENFR